MAVRRDDHVKFYLCLIWCVCVCVLTVITNHWQLQFRKTPVDDDVDVNYLVKKTDMFSGAEVRDSEKKLNCVSVNSLSLCACVCVSLSLSLSISLSLSLQVVSLCREAALYAMRERIDIEKVALRHFEQVLAILKPQTKESTLRLYESYNKLNNQ